ncbi:MAG: helix-turn-helix domain-containing protein [Cyclobacteriaceae bacterium]|nr:helix-turn-helix domain-containing protein [Cyclobacteriaceae bacterium]MCX7637597.1 helix-turn-helix domain-containing protein [Cyclobacteriaceae bacterium]MDW8330725.1 helix-turn-helix domain-containing protein [Cyclobacteriaceae bacterium]
MLKQPELGKIIRFHRKKAALSQSQLARLIGVGKSAIYDLEKGKETVQLDTLNKVLSGLNISVQINSHLMNEYYAQS